MEKFIPFEKLSKKKQRERDPPQGLERNQPRNKKNRKPEGI